MDKNVRDEFKNIKLKQTAILARQILLYFFDFQKSYISIFDTKKYYRVPFEAYDRFREDDKLKFSREMYRLKRAGVIKKYVEEKGTFLELTPKGKEVAKKYLVDQIEIVLPKHWDRKWRLVIFDIPDNKKTEREILRDKLRTIGFYQLQESVYVFPFDCFSEIDILRRVYLVGPYVQYIVAERIETEIDLLEKFYDRGLLDRKNI